jgi:hypothetical protein
VLYLFYYNKIHQNHHHHHHHHHHQQQQTLLHKLYTYFKFTYNHTIKMKFTTALLAIASAAIINATSVTINATTSGIDNPTGGFEIITADLYTLNTYSVLSVTKLELVQTQTVPPTDVECRMYKDAQGLQPGSLPFSGSTAADISTNTVEVGSILCYAIGVISE